MGHVLRHREKGSMLKKKRKRGSALIALVVVVAALAAAPAAGAEPLGFFQPDGSWAEGA